MNPRKLNISSYFLSKYSCKTFSSAYKKAPDNANMSPKIGLDASFVSPKYKKSLINPMLIPQRQIAIPNQCRLKYVTFKNKIERMTAEGIEKSSIIMTLVIDVIV